MQTNFKECKCCSDYLEKRLVYQWSLCCLVIPEKPSVSREQGGHLILFPNRHVLKRSELTAKEAIVLMRSSMIVEEAMYQVIPLLGIDLVNINICDNGNVKIDDVFEKRHLHLHFYGRVRDNENQSHREFLCLPPRSSNHYTKTKPFNEKDALLFKKKIKELDNSSKFKFND